jgi:RNA polymerase sigma-70 factor, ECF subfamily
MPDPMRLSDTLTLAMRLDDDPGAYSEEHSLEQSRELERFLAGVEKRAYRIARIAVRNDDDALDIVQDAMLQLARRYGARLEAEWRPLFYRILQNRIRDFQRRSAVRARVMSWLPSRFVGEEEPGDPYEAIADPAALPLDQLSTDQTMRLLEGALGRLPARQQEAFMLRNFEGLSVEETATAMGCTQGSVKTHYSRAVHTLRAQLEREADGGRIT